MIDICDFSAARLAAKWKPVAPTKALRMRGKRYMRRATNPVNYSKALPLALGVSFDIE